MKINLVTSAALVAIGIAFSPQSLAQQWPDRNVRILVPFPPGGGTDIQARLLSSAFQKRMGQNFIIDNRTGASGIIASQLAVESPADGNTILFTSGSISVVATLFAKQIKFDVHKDLQPVSWISSTPLVLSLHPSVPVKSVKELVALAKRTKVGMNAGGNASASTAHLSAEMLNQAAGIKSTVLHYRGGGPAIIALLSGEIDYIFATAPSVMPYLKAGKANAIAVTTAKRSSALPDLPTMNSIYQVTIGATRRLPGSSGAKRCCPSEGENASTQGSLIPIGWRSIHSIALSCITVWHADNVSATTIAASIL